MNTSPKMLESALETIFRRITLVNPARTDRLTLEPYALFDYYYEKSIDTNPAGPVFFICPEARSAPET